MSEITDRELLLLIYDELSLLKESLEVSKIVEDIEQEPVFQITTGTASDFDQQWMVPREELPYSDIMQ